MQYHLISTGDEANITVFEPGDRRFPLVAHSDHPHYDDIVVSILENEADADFIVQLFDVSVAVAKGFERLSERVTVAGGHVFLDGDEVDNSLTKQILRFIDEGLSFEPLVNFFEKVQTNPNDHSREQLYTWLDRRDFTITDSGDFVGYKGVKREGDGYVSIHSGAAVVNDKPVNGAVPNNPGDVVELARGQVHHDPSQGCASGLHVGSFDYAKGWGHGVVLEVHVNPRDVVSVPTDSDWAKVRTCRYRVVDAIDVPYTAPVVHDHDWEADEDELPVCPDCGEEFNPLDDEGCPECDDW